MRGDLIVRLQRYVYPVQAVQEGKPQPRKMVPHTDELLVAWFTPA